MTTRNENSEYGKCYFKAAPVVCRKTEIECPGRKPLMVEAAKMLLLDMIGKGPHEMSALSMTDIQRKEFYRKLYGVSYLLTFYFSRPRAKEITTLRNFEGYLRKQTAHATDEEGAVNSELPDQRAAIEDHDAPGVSPGDTVQAQVSADDWHLLIPYAPPKQGQ